MQPNEPIDVIYEALVDKECRPVRNGDRITAKCPAHDDRNPSLSVAKGTKGADVVITCFAGCEADNVVEALGLTWSDLYSKPDRPNEPLRVSAVYDYVDEAGTLLYQVVRYEPKTFRQRRPTGGNTYDYRLGDTRRVLYRLPDIERAKAEGVPVYIAEGEKDVERLRKAGLVATCNSGGAGKFTSDHAGQLAGIVEAVIVSDNDKAGRKHAKDVAALLQLARVPHRIVRSPVGKDTADLFDSGGTADDFVPVDIDDSDDEANVVLELVPPTADPLAESIVDWTVFWQEDHDATQWLVHGIIPAGRLMAIYAEAKVGKSWVMLAVCAAAASGRGIFDHPPGEPIRVLYCDMEMTSADLYERLQAHGFGPEDNLEALRYALLPNLPPLDTAEGGAALLASAIANEAQLVVIDTVSRVVEGEENSADTFQDLYRYTLMPLKAAGIACVRLDHSGKEKERGMRGSSAKRDDADVVVRIEKTSTGVAIRTTHKRIGWYPDTLNIDTGENDDGTHYMRLVADSVPAGTAVKISELDAADVPVDASNARIRKEYGIKGGNAVLYAAQQERRRRNQHFVDIDDFVPKESATELADFDVPGF